MANETDTEKKREVRHRVLCDRREPGSTGCRRADFDLLFQCSESQQKIVQRIRNVMGNSAYNARRIAQTERTRVQSQARADTIREAAEAGVVMHKRWSTRMVNSRDSHVALNGVEIPEGEKFHTIWGNSLAYPGDPDAPAREVINCHCVLVPVVLPPEGKQEKSTVFLRKGQESDIIITDKQLGRKAGKHMSEWGLNPSDAEDRQKFVNITKNILDNPHEVRRIQWLHDPKTGKRTVEVTGYIVGRDVVLVKDNGEYITTMKNGIDNERVKKGRRAK